MTHSTIASVPMLAAFALAGCGVAPESGTIAETATLAASTDALSKNVLTKAEEKTALKLIDDICGDTWCSGDDDFRFDTLVCGGVSRRCTLSLEILPRDGAPSLERDHTRICRTGNFTGFASLVDTAPNGYQSLNQDYYFALTDCISTLEAELPPPPRPCPAPPSATPHAAAP